MGKAEGSSSIVALVSFIAEEGKGAWDRGRQVNLQMCRSCANLTAIDRVHIEYLFSFHLWGAMCYFRMLENCP